MTEEGSPPPEGEEERQGMEPRSAILPISMMVALIIVTIGIALFVGPIYRNLGLSAEEEYSNNPYLILIFVVMLIAVTGVILILRKFLKRRNKRIMKLILSVAMAFAMLSVLTPMIDVAIHGIPPQIDYHEFQDGGMIDSYPIDPTDSSPMFLMIRKNSVSTFETEDGGDFISTVKGLSSITVHMGPFGKPIVTAESGGNLYLIEPQTNGSLPLEFVSHSIPNKQLTGSQMIMNQSGGEFLLLTWNGVNGSTAKAFPIGRDESPLETSNVTISNITVSTSLTWGPQNPLLFSGQKIFTATLNSSSSKLELKEYQTFPQEIRWVRQFDEQLLVGGRSSVWHLTEGSVQHLEGFNVKRPSLVTLSGDEDTYEIMLVDGLGLHSILIEKGEYVNDGRWGLENAHYAGIHSTEPKQKMFLIEDEGIMIGVLDRKPRMNLPVSLTALGITVVLMILLLRIPKWYLIDLVGILVGAGVLAFLGISIPIYLLMILMIMLAVYDFISVYITKHMITLAETVVEAKLPILLVFPKTLRYKYEEKKDLMESKRKGESMFMGLGDVIIPGSLPVSASVFLDAAGAPDFLGFISPPLAVAIFALAGMLIGFFALMALVIRGKAHAGLPFLNTGTILGFLIGHLMVYGNLSFI